MLNKKLYEALKWVALTVIPALVILVTTVGNEWGLEHVKSIAATIGAIGLFLGVILKSMPPFDGVASVIPGADLDDPDKFDINLKGLLDDPAKIENQRVIRLKVKKHHA